MRLFIQCVAGVVLSGVCMLHASAPSPAATRGPIFLKPIRSSAVHHLLAPRLRFWDGTSITDLNWSGYAVETNLNTPANGVVTAASGTWVVPAVTGSGRTHTYSSAWVGIDGDSDNTVEQIGTEQDWTRWGAQYYVWFEMYPNYAYEIANFPIAPGNVFSAEVKYLGQTTTTQRVGHRNVTVTVQNFLLTITNVTQNVTYTVPASSSVTTGAQLQSAEWIMEAPSNGYQILPMADYGAISFSNCAATINGVTGPISDVNWQDEAITASNDGTLSTPSALMANGTAFTVTWSQ